MGARAGISVDGYLHTSFPDLDREYRDGELVERSVPDYLHGRTQALLGRRHLLRACPINRRSLRSRFCLLMID